MKVLMIAPCPYNLDEIKGGVEAVTVNLLQGFREISDIEMRVVSVRKELEKEESVSYSDNITIQYIPFDRIKSTRLEMVFHGRRKVKQIIKEFQPDIVHVQSVGSVLFFTLGLRKDNLIVTQHGILREEYKYKKTIFCKCSVFIDILIEMFFIKHINNIIFISKYNENLFHITYNKAPNSKLIYNPVNEGFFNIPLKDINNRLLFVGGIGKLKGLLDLIKVISHLKSSGKNYHLDVIGGILEEYYMNEIQTFITNNRLKDYIELHGWLSQPDIIKFMNEISILVLPSYQETLPVTIAEAMAAGKVVIATNVGGISEMIEDKKTGFLFEKGDVKELERILLLFFRDYKLMREISENARMRAKEMFKANSVVNQTVDFYRSILKTYSVIVNE